MTQFEYKIYECNDSGLKDESLNEFGREGWELVTHNAVAIPVDEYGVSVWHYFSFRRPLVTTEESCYDDDGWSYDEWQEHQKKNCETGKRSKGAVGTMIREEICTFDMLHCQMGIRLR